MTIYSKLISKATGVTDEAVLQKIEDTMRDYPESNGVLDHLTSFHFDRIAKWAHKMVTLDRPMPSEIRNALNKWLSSLK